MLEKLLDTADRLEASRFLVAAYQRNNDHQGLVRALTTIARATRDPSERLSSLERASEIYRKNLERPDLALAAITQSLEQAPADAGLHQLARTVATEIGALPSLREGLAALLDKSTGPAKLMLHKQLAALGAANGKSGESVAGHLRAVLEVAPGDLEAIDALRRFHEQRSEWAALAEVTERLARFSAEAEAQSNAWRAAARLHQQKLLDDESALECWLKVLETKPSDPEALQATEKVAFALGRPAVWQKALDRARTVAVGAEKTTLTIKLAELLAQKLGNPEAAVALCREVLAGEPDHPGARALIGTLVNPTEELLAALKSLHTAADRAALLPKLKQLALEADALEEVAEAVEEESENVEDPNGLAPLLRFAAQVREQLGQGPRATVLWNDLLAVKPDDTEALEHLSRLLAGADDEKHAAEISLRRARLEKAGRDRLHWSADAASRFIAASMPEAALHALDEALANSGGAAGSELARVHLLRGQLLERGGNVAAVTSYAKALEAPELEEQAAAGLERLMAQLETRLAAARVAEPVMRKLGDPRRLAAALEALLEAIESPQEQTQKLAEIARLWEAAGEARVALGAQLRLFSLSPNDEPVRLDLERLATSLGAADELAAAYEERLEREPNVRRALFSRRVAELLDTLGERDRAFEAWAVATEASAHDLELVRSFAEKARLRGDLKQLAKAMRWQSDAMPPSPGRDELLHKLARIYEDGLSDMKGAAAAYEKLLETQAGDRALLRSLTRLYEEGHDDAGLRRALERDLALARQQRSAEATAIALRLAKLKLSDPKDEAGALELLRQVLDGDPGNAHAVATLSQLASAKSAVQPEAAKLAAQALDRLGDFPVVVQILESQLAATQDPKERAGILAQIAELRAGPLKDPELAFLAITRALREAPDDPKILERCASIADAAGSSDDLEDLLAELAGAQAPGKGKASLLRALAKRQETRGATEDAIASWTQAVAEAPSDADARAHLSAMLEKGQRYGDLVQLAQRRLESATPEDRPAALAALAAAKERAGQLDEAASTLLSLFALTQSRDTLLSLERVLERQGRHSERAEALRRLAETTQDPKERVDRLVQQARSLVAAQEPELAVTVFSQVLDRDPNEPRAVADLVALTSDPKVRSSAVELLESVFRGLNQGWQRVAVLEVLVECAGPEHQRKLRAELATLLESLSDQKQAFAHRLRLVTDRPDDLGARSELERLARDSKLEEELLASYEDLLDRPLEPKVAAGLRGAVARLQSVLGRPDLAIAAWEEVSRLEPSALEPLESLAGLHRRQGDFAKLAKVLKKQSGLLPQAADQIAALRELAKISEQQLAQPGDAAEAWKRLAEKAPNDVEALSALSRLTVSLGRHEDAARIFERQLAIAGSREDAAALELKLGQLKLGPLAKPAEALKHFARALESRQTEAEAMAGLEQLTQGDPALAPQAAARLEPLVRSAGDSARLARLLELQVASADPARRRALLDELAGLREQTGDPSAAFASRRAVYQANPDPRSRAELERLAGLTNRWSELIDTFEARLEAGAEGEEAVELWRRIAQTCQRLSQRQGAVRAWEQVARLTPDDPAPLVALCELHLAGGAYGQLPMLMMRRTELEPSVERQVTLLLELAELYENKLRDPNGAIEICRAALMRVNDDPKTIATLERLLDGQSRFAELGELLLAQIGAASGSGNAARALDLKVRLASLQHRALKKDADALSLLLGVLNAEPAHAAAIETLEEMMRSGRPSSGQAAEILESHYARQSDQGHLIESIEVRGEWASSLESRAALLHRIADLHEAAGSPSGAYDALDRLLRELPQDERALDRVLALAEPAQAKSGVVTLLAELLPRAPASTQVRMLAPLARLRAELDDVAGAITAWRQLLQLRPDDREALETCSKLLEISARWPELVQLLEQRLALEHSQDGQAELLSHLGTLRDDLLADAPGAWAAFERLHQLRPEDSSVLARLDGLAERLEKWPELAEVLEKRIRLEPELRTELLLKLAQVRRVKLDRGGSALPLLLEVLDTAPDDPRALDELAQLVAEQPGWEPARDVLLTAYRRRADFPKLIATLDACAGLALTGESRCALFVELAELRLSHESDPELAFLAYAKAFRESANDPAMRERLVELGTLSGSHEALAALLDELIPSMTPAAAAEATLVVGGLCEGALREPERAVELYRQAIDAVPETAPRALVNLQRVLETLGRFEELIPVLESLERAATDPAAKIALLSKIAGVALEKLSKPARAAEAYQAILGLDPRQLDAARALESIYERTGEREKLLDVLDHLLGHVPREQRPEVRLKIARLCVTLAPERTIAQCRQLLSDDPLHAEAFTLLTDRLEAAARYSELVQVLRSRLQLTLSPADAAELGYRLGELTWRRLSDPAGAIAHFTAVLARAPRHLGALEALRELYETKGNKRELAQTLAKLVGVMAEPADRRQLEVRRAEVLHELGDGAGAVQAAHEALELKPDAREVERLRPLLLARNAWDDAARALSLAAAYQLESKQLTAAIATLFELAQVHGKRNDVAGATQALETILLHEPARREAYDQARTLYANAAQWSDWANLVSTFLPHLETAEKLKVLDELAERHEVNLIDPPGAFDWAQQVVRLDPASPERRARIERLARSLHREAALAKLYRELLQGISFSRAYVAIALSLASVEDEVLDQVDAAGKTLIQLLEQDPGNAEALAALGKMYERRAMHLQLANTLELELETAKTAADRARLLERIARLHEEKLKDPKAAAHALQRMFELDRTPERAGLLIALHQRHQQWPEAINMLLALRQLMPTAIERAKIQLQICELYESKVADPEAAVAGYLQALELDPASSVAFRALERLYLKLERPAELLRAYERRLVRVDDVEEKIELLYKSAVLFERRGGRVQADRCLVQITEVRPSELRALEDLAKLRRIDERWKPLAETLTRLVEVLDDAPRRAELCTELGHVFTHLRDPAVALKWWNKALEYQLDHRPAIQALAQLHQQEGRWQEAAKYLDRDAVMEKEPARRALLEHQSGVVKEEKLRQIAPAKDSYRRALVADPVHLPSLRRLRALFLKAGEWQEYEANLEHEATRAPQPGDRFSAASELAQHLRARAHDADGAIKWYEHALVQKPGLVEAAIPLADLLVAGKHWPRAVVVLQGLASALQAEKPLRKSELVLRLCQLGEATKQAGKPEQALREWDRALALEPMQPEALRGQFEVLDDSGKSAEAMARLEQLLQAQPRAADRAALHTRLGELYWQHGRTAEAQASGERALSVEAGNVPALKLLVASCEEQALFEKSVLYRQRLAGLLPEPERPGMLFELGVVAQEKLKKPARAIEAFVSSLALKPNEKRVLERLHVAYREAGHNRKAAETLQALIELPELSVNERRGHTLALADQVSKGNELDRAVGILEKGLDRDPSFTEAFTALEQLLSNAQQWAKLDLCFERMIARFGEHAQTGPARAALWRRLAELRRSRLKDTTKALAALEQAARLLPNDATTQEAFADLAIELPNRTEDAVLAYQRALPLTTQPEKYRSAVAKLATRRNDVDTAILAARASLMMGSTPPAEKALLDKWAAQAPVPPQFRAPLSDQNWKEQLLHPDTRGPLGELLAFIYEHAGAKYAADPGDFKLNPKKHTLDLRAASHPALRQLALTGRALGFESLNVLSPWFAPQSSSKRSPHPDDQASFRIYPTFPFTLVVGERFFNERDPAALAALIGSRLAYLRPELALSQWPPDQLALTFEAALSLVNESRASPADPKLLKAEVKKLSKALSSQARAGLSEKVYRYLKVAKPNDLPKYFDGARQTPIRTALLVAGDFAATARIFPEGEAAHGSLRQLLHFALGGELSALRKATGCAVTAR
ncbi:MAG: hypothetical protein QM723_38815 [Myxococcaceae bacterium]